MDLAMSALVVVMGVEVSVRVGAHDCVRVSTIPANCQQT
jgi:hypothetical protein